MNDRHIYTPEEKAMIELRIEQGFTFLQDVLENPAIVEVVPEGSEFRFQEVVAGATNFHLVAFRPQNAPEDPWVARVIKPAEYASEHRNVARPEDVPGAGGNPVTRPEVGDTAEAALEALAAKLLAAQPRVLKTVVDDRRTA